MDTPPPGETITTSEVNGDGGCTDRLKYFQHIKHKNSHDERPIRTFGIPIQGWLLNIEDWMNANQYPVSEGNRPGDRTGFERDILFGLSRRGPCNGQDLRREIAQLYSVPVTRGRLYPALNKLARDELVTIEKEHGGGRCNRYNVTPTGEQLITSLAMIYSKIQENSEEADNSSSSKCHADLYSDSVFDIE